MSSKNGDFIDKQKQSVRVRLPKRTKKARERESSCRCCCLLLLLLNAQVLKIRERKDVCVFGEDKDLFSSRGW